MIWNLGESEYHILPINRVNVVPLACSTPICGEPAHFAMIGSCDTVPFTAALRNFQESPDNGKSL